MSAWPTPCATPPWIWPLSVTGLITVPDVVDDHVAHDRDGAGIGVDLDLADVAAVGPRGLLGRERSRLVETRARRRAAAAAGWNAARATSLSATARSVPTTPNLPSANTTSASAASSRRAAIFLPLVITLSAACPQRGAADDGRPRAHRAHAEGDPVRVAVDVEHVGRIEAEPLVENLLERGLVALALVLGAHAAPWRSRSARSGSRRTPAAAPRRLLDRVDDGQAAQLAATP